MFVWVSEKSAIISLYSIITGEEELTALYELNLQMQFRILLVLGEVRKELLR
jgi:hypothetical protein